VKEHRFSVSDVRESTVRSLVGDLRAKGYNVVSLSSRSKGSILGDEVADRTFVIRDAGYTEGDLRVVTGLITDPNRGDPIRLKRTEVDQTFVSASGEGSAAVELTIELTQNARAFYKGTGEPIHLRRRSGQQSATFAYQRKPGEEYVDIYIVPDYAEKGFTPKTFLRISLAYPYTADVMPWKTWYRRGWEYATAKCRAVAVGVGSLSRKLWSWVW
jgi:hypothetical protein